MNNWKKVTLNDIGKIVTGKTPKTKNTEFWNGGIPFVTPADLQKSKHIFSTERTVSHIGLNSVKGATLPAGAVCVSCIGNLGYTALTTQKSVSNQQINSIIPNSDFDNDFVYYLMKSLWDEFKNLEGQSTTLSILNKTLFSKIEVLVPEKVTQQRIAQLLSSLDDKIELNAQINHNLEEQAALIFADWLQGCNESVAIGDLSTNILDYTPINNGFVRLLNSSDVTEGVFPDIQLVPNANLKGHFKKRFQLGDILYSEIRPRNHHYGFVLFDASEYIASTRLMVIRALDYKVSPAMLYQYLLLPNVEAEFTLKTESRSGTFPQGNYADIASIKIPYAPVKAQNEVSSTLTKIRQTIANNQLENRQLSELRDALLPKLMSGEIDVSEVEV
jgi:restriction modification system DNA specificity domain protein